MILLDGILPTLSLGVSYLKPNEVNEVPSIILGTRYEGEIHTLGLIELSLNNISKLRNFKYNFLVKEQNGEWTPSKESLQLLIPREFEENDVIGGIVKNNEEIEF